MRDSGGSVTSFDVNPAVLRCTDPPAPRDPKRIEAPVPPNAGALRV
jgi:hypothetical protein